MMCVDMLCMQECTPELCTAEVKHFNKEKILKYTYICMYVHICVCVCVCVYIYIYIYIYIKQHFRNFSKKQVLPSEHRLRN